MYEECMTIMSLITFKYLHCIKLYRNFRILIFFSAVLFNFCGNKYIPVKVKNR